MHSEWKRRQERNHSPGFQINWTEWPFVCLYLNIRIAGERTPFAVRYPKAELHIPQQNTPPSKYLSFARPFDSHKLCTEKCIQTSKKNHAKYTIYIIYYLVKFWKTKKKNFKDSHIIQYVTCKLSSIFEINIHTLQHCTYWRRFERVEQTVRRWIGAIACKK